MVYFNDIRNKCYDIGSFELFANNFFYHHFTCCTPIICYTRGSNNRIAWETALSCHNSFRNLIKSQKDRRTPQFSASPKPHNQFIIYFLPIFFFLVEDRSRLLNSGLVCIYIWFYWGAHLKQIIIDRHEHLFAQTQHTNKLINTNQTHPFPGLYNFFFLN